MIEARKKETPVPATRDTASVKLDKMPESLEVRFALSAIPPHPHEGATAYTLHPSMGYVVNQPRNERFSCIVVRSRS